LSEGDSLNTHPENTRFHTGSDDRVSRSCTSNCTNAPVSGTGSHGAVRSQAESRTMASPIRRDSPGFISRSRVSPFRLLRNEMVATRSAIGVASPATKGTGGRAAGFAAGLIATLVGALLVRRPLYHNPP
jgi:hypothetical protein